MRRFSFVVALASALAGCGASSELIVTRDEPLGHPVTGVAFLDSGKTLLAVGTAHARSTEPRDWTCLSFWSSSDLALLDKIANEEVEGGRLEVSWSTRDFEVGDLEVWRHGDDGRKRRFHGGVAKKHACFAISPDGRELASAAPGWNEVELYELADGARAKPREIRIMKARREDEGRHAGHVALAYSRDGRTLALLGADSVVRLLSLETKRVVGSIGEARGHDDWAFERSDSAFIARALAARSPSDLVQRGPEFQIAFSPDGDRLAWIDGATIEVVRFSTGERKHLRGHEADVTSFAFSPRGDALASASRDGTVRLWSLWGPLLVATLRGHDGDVLSVAFSPDGERIASGGEDGTIRLWSLR